MIAGYAELLASRDDEHTRREAIAKIQEGVARLAALVDAIEAPELAADGVEEDQPRAARARPGGGAGGRCRIMIVDDDATLRHLVRTSLPTDEIDVVEAQDGADALEQIRTRAPDLLVLDWNMPNRSGSAVLDELQTSHPELPVIVLTAEKRPSHRALAHALGARVFLTKPFSPRELLETVLGLLPNERRRGLRPRAEVGDDDRDVEAAEDPRSPEDTNR